MSKEQPKKPITKNRYRFVEAANQFRESIKSPLVFWVGHYWKYTGTHYEKIGKPEDLSLMIDRWHQTANSSLDISDHTTTEIESRLRAQLFLDHKQAFPARLNETSGHKFLVTLKNGLLDLEPCTRGLGPQSIKHGPEWLTTACLPYEYDPEARCPRWLAFLRETLQDDPERIALMQEWYGYCCTHDTSLEKMMLMEGPGGNGKSQALTVLEALVGKHNTSSVPLEKLGERFRASETLGKLINICGEIDEGSKIPLSTIKMLVSGDSYSFEKKFLDSFTATPTARLIMSMNTRPVIKDYTNAFWRRLLLVPWTYKVPADKIVLDIGRKIAGSELPGIFNWAMEGLMRVWTRTPISFTESKVVKEAVSEFRLDTDPLQKWLLEHYEASEPGFVSRTLIWNDVLRADSCGEVALPYNYTAPKFYVDLLRVFPGLQDGRGRVGNANLRGFKGLRVKGTQ